MPTDFDESILLSLRRISRAIDLYSRRLAAQYKLTGPQLMCLRKLSQVETITSGALASDVALSQATVTGILDRLESRELVTRKRDVRDKRRVLIRITEAGSKLEASAPVPLQKQFADRLDRLPLEDQSNIDQVLSQVVKMMSADDLDAAPMMTPGPATVAAGEIVEFLTPEQTGKNDK